MGVGDDVRESGQLGKVRWRAYVLATPPTRLMRSISRMFVVAAIVGMSPSRAHAQGNDAAANIAVIPRPQSVVAATGKFTLSPRTTIWSDKADSAVARRFARNLAPATAMELPMRIGTSATGNRIVFRRASSRDTTLGAEGYRLDVRPGVVTITSSAPAGAFYATQTLRQLLPPTSTATAPVSASTVDDSRRRRSTTGRASRGAACTSTSRATSCRRSSSRSTSISSRCTK